MDNCLVLKFLTERTLAEKGKKLFLGFVDFKTAYDMVNRDLLFYQLGKKGVSTKMVDAVRGVYEKVSCSVLVEEGVLSESFDSNRGVKQGCVFSALLFSIIVDDVIDYLKAENTHPPCFNGRDEIPGLLYADDLVIISTSAGGLQKGFQGLEKFCKDRDMVVNDVKTKCMVVKRGYTFSKNERWSYKGVELDRVKSFNYLGVVFSMDGKWGKQVEMTSVKAGVASKQVQKLVCKLPSSKIFTKIYKEKISPIVTYGAQIWGIEVGDRLNRVKGNFYKGLLGLGKSAPVCAALSEFGELNVDYELKLAVIRQWYRIETSGREDSFCFLGFQDMKRRKLKGSWVMKVEECLNELGLGWVFRLGKNNKKGVLRVVKERIEDIGKQEVLA